MTYYIKSFVLLIRLSFQDFNRAKKIYPQVIRRQYRLHWLRDAVREAAIESHYSE